MDTKDVPRGAVAAVTYYSKALGKFRRMHIYTPPGYESGKGKFPVFYLLHGAGDSDEAWTSVGRAGFILDNLIAADGTPTRAQRELVDDLEKQLAGLVTQFENVAKHDVGKLTAGAKKLGVPAWDGPPAAAKK